MKLEVYKTDGTSSGGSVTLPDDIFNVEPNDHVLYLVVKAHLANQRQGTHKAKERSEVRGGGRKPWRQKGRGAARVGTIRSPLWVGGGSTFGPRVRDYRQKINKKTRLSAAKSALTYKAKDERITVVEDFDYEEPKTRNFEELMVNFDLYGEKVLLLTKEYQAYVYKSGRNIPGVKVNDVKNATTYDIMNADYIVMQKGALDIIKERFSSVKKVAG